MPGETGKMARIKPYTESKFMVKAAQACELHQLFANFCQPDSHGIKGVYEVLSIYYDTPGLEFLNEKIHGEFNKTKVRIRLYRNEAGEEWHDPCLEIKQRTGSLVAKSRLDLENASIHDLLNIDLRDLILERVANPVFIKSFADKIVKPVIMVHYRRKALQFTQIEGLRFTFDDLLTGVLPTAAAFSPDYDFTSHSIMQNHGNVFEIKSYSTVPDSILSQLERKGIQQQSFSKFATMLRFQLERYDDRRLIV